MAGNPLIISPDRLKDEGLLAEEDEADLPAFPVEKVDFEQVAKPKFSKKACENFKANASPVQQKEFAGFCETKAYWLDDYAPFMALKDAHVGILGSQKLPVVNQKL